MTDQPSAVWNSVANLLARPVPPFHLEVFDEDLNIWPQRAIDTGLADQDGGAYIEGVVGDIIIQGIVEDAVLLKDMVRDRDYCPVK